MSDYWAKVDRLRTERGREPYGSAQEYVLQQMMDFDHVVQVLDDGTVIDYVGDVYAPTLHDDHLSGAWHGLSGKRDEWTLMNGYSGQDRYAGPIMHESEFIGGQMARDILETPGVYVAVVAYYSPEDDEDAEDEIGGWAVAKLDEHLTELGHEQAYTGDGPDHIIEG